MRRFKIIITVLICGGFYVASLHAESQKLSEGDSTKQQKDRQRIETRILAKDAKSTVQAKELDYRGLLTNKEYVEIFENQMRLILSEYWSEDGNWRGDMMNDATGFAPKLFFKIYAKNKNEELYRKAMTTCKYQKNLIKEALQGKQRFDINSIFGCYCLLACMEHAQTAQERIGCQLLIWPGLNLFANSLLSDSNQPLMQGLEEYKCIALPIAAVGMLEYYDITKDNYMLETAKKLIKTHENEFYNEETGLFTDQRFGRWNSGLGLLAYAKVYAATKEQQYLQKAEKLIQNLREKDSVFDGVFFNEILLEKEDNWVLYLSDMLIYTQAFLELYESTGNEGFKHPVKKSIDFAIEELTLSRAYPEGINDMWFDNEKRLIPFFSHDIEKTDGVKKVSPSYCLGCNLMMLNHIWDYNQDSRNKSSVGIVSKATEGNFNNTSPMHQPLHEIIPLNHDKSNEIRIGQETEESVKVKFESEKVRDMFFKSVCEKEVKRRKISKTDGMSLHFPGFIIRNERDIAINSKNTVINVHFRNCDADANLVITDNEAKRYHDINEVSKENK